MRLFLLPALFFASGAWASNVPKDLPNMILAGLAEATEEFSDIDQKFGLRDGDAQLQNAASGLTLTWQTPKGQNAVSNVEIIGDFSAPSGAFAWAWANKSVPNSMSKTSISIRKHGEKHSIPTLTNGSTRANLQFAEKLASIATLYDGVEGIFGLELKDKGVALFLALGPVSLKK